MNLTIWIYICNKNDVFFEEVKVEYNGFDNMYVS